MADRGFGLPRPQPEPTAQVPTLSETWVERQSAVSQFNSRIDIFAEVSKNVCDIAQDARIITPDPKRPSRELDALAAARYRIVGPARYMESHMGNRGKDHTRSGRWWAVRWIGGLRQFVVPAR